MSQTGQLDWARDGTLWPYHEASAFIAAAGYHWHVQRFAGAREKPQLLLIHGTGASVHSWAWMIPLLKDQFDILAFDLPGHGFTRTDRYRAPTLSVVSAAIKKLLDGLAFTPDIIMGHSAGAAIMLEMMAREPGTCRLGISINGALLPFPGPARHLFPAMAKMLHFNPFTAGFFAQSARDPRRVQRLITQTGSTVPAQSTDCYERLFATSDHVRGALALMANWDLTRMPDKLSSINVPIIFVSGEKDRAVPARDARRCAAMARRGTLITLPGLGHLAHEEAPDQIVAALQRGVHEALGD
ncbi:MAG: alpha/beta fold hydrolase BchO [Pseudomonadota bacterium]